MQNTSEERPQKEDSSDGEEEKMVKDLHKTQIFVYWREPRAFNN